MGRMIDADDWDAISDAVRRHPYYLGGVVWCVEDVMSECKRFGIDYSEVHPDLNMIDFRGWEGEAISSGWPVITEFVFANHEPDGFDELMDRMMTDSKFYDDIVGGF